MMFHFYVPEGICFAAFVALSCTWLHYARFLLCFSVVFFRYFSDSSVCVCLFAFSCCLSVLCFYLFICLLFKNMTFRGLDSVSVFRRNLSSWAQ
jgi:hypothetical protein